MFVHVEVGQNWGKDLKPGRAEYACLSPASVYVFPANVALGQAAKKEAVAVSGGQFNNALCIVYSTFDV